MTKHEDTTHGEPLALRLSEGLGPLPETDVWAIGSLDVREDVEAYSAEAMEAERQRCYALGVATERARCVRICEEHAADKNPPFKDYEDNYLDGWLDAANECGWAIQGPNGANEAGQTAPR